MTPNDDSKEKKDALAAAAEEVTAENPTKKIPNSLEALGEELVASKMELEKSRNEYLYLRADFDNYKKGVIRERSDLVKYGSQSVFVELLEVADNFERALSTQVKNENLDSFKQGVLLIGQEIRALLSRFGITEIPSEGMKFDPNLHNAIGTEPNALVPSGHISKVLKKPYRLHDRVIRPGQVIIATEPQVPEGNN